MDLQKVPVSFVHEFAASLLAIRDDHVDMADQIEAFTQYIDKLPSPEEEQ